MSLTKEQIFAANDLATEPVDVKEWGGSVIVRSMTGADRDAFESSLVTFGEDGKRIADLSNMRAKLVAMTVVDENGDRLFTAEDIGAIAHKSASAIERVYQVAQRLNGMGTGAVDAAVKNSMPDQSESSTSV